MRRERRPRVYYARGPRGLETGLGGSINVETIELLAQNVAGANARRAGHVSIEQVLLWNPDVIITIDRDFAANVYERSRLGPGQGGAGAAACILSPKLPFGWVDFPPCVNRLIGLWWLAKILYPELFPEDLRALTRDFYARFYHRHAERRADRACAGGTGLAAALATKRCHARASGHPVNTGQAFAEWSRTVVSTRVRCLLLGWTAPDGITVPD